MVSVRAILPRVVRDVNTVYTIDDFLRRIVPFAGSAFAAGIDYVRKIREAAKRLAASAQQTDQ